jgi:hypothetical protein
VLLRYGLIASAPPAQNRTTLSALDYTFAHPGPEPG